MRYGLSLGATATEYRSRRTMDAQRVIAVDLGGTKLLAGVVDANGVVVRRTVRPTTRTSENDLIAEVEGAVAELSEDAGGAIGVGIPSTIDQRAGRSVSSVNIPLADFHLPARFHVSDRVPA